MKFYIIVATDVHGGIGVKNKLPWEMIKEDMAFFKRATVGGTVIMGRNTWESIPDKYKPLPDRINVVVSNTGGGTDVKDGGRIVCRSLDGALLISKGKTFVIGGGQLYKEAINHIDCAGVFRTLIKKPFKCDTFFQIAPSLNVISLRKSDQKGLEFEFQFIPIDNQ